MDKVHGESVRARGALPTIGGRAHPEEIRLIDQAALEVGEKRGIFLVTAAVERARRVLKRSRAGEVTLPQDAPAALVGPGPERRTGPDQHSTAA